MFTENKTILFLNKRFWFLLLLLIPIAYFLKTKSPTSVDIFEDDFSQVDQLYEELKIDDSLDVATVAGGCFWCMEAGIEPAGGVVEVISGYAGTSLQRPSYNQVVSGSTNFREAAQIFYDPTIISYGEVLSHYWNQIDPTDPGGQFSDRGSHYTTAIFYENLDQQEIALESKKQLEASDLYQNPIVTEISPITYFYPAEDYHQDYYKNNKRRYDLYAQGSGRKSHINKGLLDNFSWPWK